MLKPFGAGANLPIPVYLDKRGPPPARSRCVIPVERSGDDEPPDQGLIKPYTRAAVPLYSAVFSAADAPDVIRLNAFHSSV